MKPSPAPSVPGSTNAERMSNALGIVLKVSKEELLRREEEARKLTPSKPKPVRPK